MYVLYLYGAIVERMYGHVEFAAIYLLCAAGGSVLTILVDPTQFAAGASGAIFGLVGLLFVVSRRHHAVLGREARTMVAGIGSYLVFLLVFTFVVPGISWTGHLGGLIVGAALGFLLPPTGVATMAGMWRTPAGERLDGAMPAAVRAVDLCRRGRALAAGRTSQSRCWSAERAARAPAVPSSRHVLRYRRPPAPATDPRRGRRRARPAAPRAATGPRWPPRCPR